MRFQNSRGYYGTRTNECDPVFRPAKWFQEAREKATSLLCTAINEYKCTLCSEAVAEKAIARYNKESRRFCEGNEIITEDGKVIFIQNCMEIPGVTVGAAYEDNPIKTSCLGEKSEYHAQMLLIIESLAKDFDDGTESERKKIFSLMFNDDEKRFSEICQEVLG